MKDSLLSFNLQTPVLCNGVKFEMIAGGQAEGANYIISAGLIRFYGTKANSLWVKTVEPLEVRKFESGDWQEYDGLPLGTVTLEEGAIVKTGTFDYNWNGYNLNTADDAKNLVASLGLPEYKDFKQAPSNTWLRADSDLFLFAHFTAYTSFSCSLKDENGVPIPTNVVGLAAISNAPGCLSISIPKGYYYRLNPNSAFSPNADNGIWICRLKGAI